MKRCVQGVVHPAANQMQPRDSGHVISFLSAPLCSLIKGFVHVVVFSKLKFRCTENSSSPHFLDHTSSPLIQDFSNYEINEKDA